MAGHRPKRLDGSYAMMVAGPGLPAGGLEGQYPRKLSDADYDIGWTRVHFEHLSGTPYDNDALAEALNGKSATGHTHDDRYYKEDEVDTLLAQLAATIPDEYVLPDPVMAAEWAPNWTGDADVYIPALEAMTIAQGNAKIGTGTITFEKSTTAAPGTFSSTTLPATLQAGAWLRVIATGVTGFCATHLVRTA